MASFWTINEGPTRPSKPCPWPCAASRLPGGPSCDRGHDFLCPEIDNSSNTAPRRVSSRSISRTTDSSLTLNAFGPLVDPQGCTHPVRCLDGRAPQSFSAFHSSDGRTSSSLSLGTGKWPVAFHKSTSLEFPRHPNWASLLGFLTYPCMATRDSEEFLRSFQHGRAGKQSFICRQATATISLLSESCRPRYVRV